MKHIQERIIQLLELAEKTLSTQKTSSHPITTSSVNHELYLQFKTSSLSFILSVYGQDHPYYHSFSQTVARASPHYVQNGRGILKSIKIEIDNGWLNSLKGLISAEIFSDFLEMAQHLLQEGYKDPSAVMIGSVLEEQLRQLCVKNSISTEIIKDGKTLSKKSEALNSELSTNGIYNKLDQKNVTSWLDLRNKAAHGKYEEYNHAQVELMLNAVTEFLTRNNN